MTLQKYTKKLINKSMGNKKGENADKKIKSAQNCKPSVETQCIFIYKYLIKEKNKLSLQHQQTKIIKL